MLINANEHTVQFAEKISSWLQSRKKGQPLIFLTISQGVLVLRHSSLEGLSTARSVLLHLGIYTEHKKGWITSQHLGAAFSPLHNFSFSVTSSRVEESFAKTVEVCVNPLTDDRDAPRQVGLLGKEMQDVTCFLIQVELAPLRVSSNSRTIAIARTSMM